MSSKSSNNPLKQILNVRREEAPMVLLFFLYAMLVIASFWILKPLKKGLFIGFYDQMGLDLMGWHLGAAQAELLAKVLNMVVAFVAVTIFTLLVRNFQRERLTYIFSAFFMVGYILYSLVIDEAGALTVWSFYLFGDLFSTLMVATFFAFLNDSVDSDAAKRLYGPIVLGALAGGPVGSTAKAVLDLEASGWLWLCTAVTVLIVLLAAGLGKITNPSRAEEGSAEDEVRAEGNPALEGARLVFRSPYLLSIVAIVGLYEMVSTIMDFQFSATVAHYLEGKAIGDQFDLVFAITNWVSFFVQIFLTSLVMTRFGIGVALLFLPAAAIMGSVGFMVVPVLWVGSLLNTADNGFSYSINQSAKEALYVPTSRDEKYKAKAFIDMFVQRFAKAVAVGMSLAITTAFTGFESVRWLSLLTALILVGWILAVRLAGRGFAERESARAG